MRATFPKVLSAIAIGAVAVVTMERLFDAVLAQVLLLVLLIVVVIGVGVALRPERRMPILCDPFLLCFAFLGQFYVIGPLVMGTWGLSPVLFFRAPGIDAAVWPLVGCLCLVSTAILGYRMEVGRVVAERLPDFRSTPRKLPRVWIVAALAGGGALGCLWWIDYQGGLLAKLGLGYGAGKSGAAFALAYNAVILGTILWAWHLMDGRASRRARVAFYGMLLLEAIFFGVIYGVRKYLFFLFFGLLTCWALRRGVRALPKLRTAAILAGLLVFFSVWGSVRATPVAVLLGIGENRQLIQEHSYQYGYLSGVADPFGTASLIWQIFPGQEQFRHGRTLLVTVLGFIPRALWPDKPVGVGKDLTRYYVGPFYEPTEGFSITVTLPADLYLNFGWPGLAIGGFLFGLLCRTVVSYAVQGMRDGRQFRASRVLVPTVFAMGLGEVRADMAQMLAFYAMTGAPLLFALAFFRMDGRLEAQPPATEVLGPALAPQAG